ncbi:hypothetical protein [Sphingomonas sp. S2-65]|uniref:hypothetical protein n=1 Tax=Sphingomonas sp. S2-65 TaxID=2903960 RepID=UPI001F473B95|nr:hypothetical protein [Sphingomonas sp. S2-65]UYY59578.1 hypothetical protein LZ586_05705 [Sphingomonas sp. S2-65]
MTKRDLRWRLGGVALFAAAAGLGLASSAGVLAELPGLSISLGLVAFLLYMAGAVLVIQGERLPTAWRSLGAGRRPQPLPSRQGAERARLSPTRRRDMRHARHHH